MKGDVATDKHSYIAFQASEVRCGLSSTAAADPAHHASSFNVVRHGDSHMIMIDR